MNKRIRVLAIAPYEGLKNILLDAVEGRSHIDMQIHVGDLDEGVKMVKGFQEDSYDLIISRGGTAMQIRNFTTVPVVEIRLSEYDILHAIRLAQSYYHVMVVGFESIIERVDSVCKLLDINVDTHVIKSVDEIEPVMLDLKRKNIPLVIGDTSTTNFARKFHMNSMLITSGKESVMSAIDQVELIYQAMNLLDTQISLYREVMDRSPMGNFVCTKEGAMLYSNNSGKIMAKEHPNVIGRLAKYAARVFEDSYMYIIFKSRGFLWHIEGVWGHYSKIKEGCALFYVRKTKELVMLDKALSFQEEIHDLPFHHFYEYAEIAKPIMRTASKYAVKDFPVMILGERGTGKDLIAWSMHNNSRHKDKTLIVLNCKYLNRKMINFLVQSEDSPLSEDNFNIYFKNTHFLNAEHAHLLVKYIRDTALHKRNRVFYSSETALPNCSGDVLMYYLMHEGDQSCMSLTLPSLRDCIDDIPRLSSVCIHELNVLLGKQIVGMDSGSIQTLQEFPWLFNVEQFIKVLRELVLITDDAYIHVEDTTRVLEKEGRYNTKQESMLTQGTLDEIVSNIINQVLQEENMNQTQASKRLGIGRSTMWRKLKHETTCI